MNDNEEKKILSIFYRLEQSAKFLLIKNKQKFCSGAFAHILNEAEISALIQDIQWEISKKVHSKEIDELGMYNYFKTSVKNRIFDLYKSHAETQKRGSVNITHGDPTPDQISKDFSYSPQDVNDKNTEIAWMLERLKAHDFQLFLFMTMMFQEKTKEEICEVLGISVPTFERTKAKAFNFLRQLSPELSFDYLSPISTDIRFYQLNQQSESKSNKILSIDLKYDRVNHTITGELSCMLHTENKKNSKSEKSSMKKSIYKETVSIDLEQELHHKLKAMMQDKTLLDSVEFDEVNVELKKVG